MIALSFSRPVGMENDYMHNKILETGHHFVLISKNYSSVLLLRRLSFGGVDTILDHLLHCSVDVLVSIK